MKNEKYKRKKITQEIIDGILSNKLCIWIYIRIDNQEVPMQVAFPGQAVLHTCYPKSNSYFTAPNADDKFYFKEYDYFWFVCPIADYDKAMTSQALEKK